MFNQQTSRMTHMFIYVLVIKIRICLISVNNESERVNSTIIQRKYFEELLTKPFRRQKIRIERCLKNKKIYSLFCSVHFFSYSINTIAEYVKKLLNIQLF